MTNMPKPEVHPSPEYLRERIAQLHDELAVAMQVEREQKEALRRATPIKYRFFIKPVDMRYSPSRIWDKSCTLWHLYAEIANKKEAEAVGHNVDSDGKGMNYLYNTLSKRFVMALGGGHVWITDSHWGLGKKDPMILDASTRFALYALSVFVEQHPKGGEVSPIIARHREETREGIEDAL